MTAADKLANLAALRKLLDERAVECPGNKGFPEKNWHQRASLDSLYVPQCCRGTARIPDPQYDALRAVLLDICPGDWGDLPSGALWGALIVALEWTLLKFSAWEQLKELDTDRPDLDLAALQAVRAALEVAP